MNMYHPCKKKRWDTNKMLALWPAWHRNHCACVQLKTECTTGVLDKINNLNLFPTLSNFTNYLGDCLDCSEQQNANKKAFTTSIFMGKMNLLQRSRLNSTSKMLVGHGDNEAAHPPCRARPTLPYLVGACGSPTSSMANCTKTTESPTLSPTPPLPRANDELLI